MSQNGNMPPGCGDGVIHKLLYAWSAYWNINVISLEILLLTKNKIK